MWSCFRLGYVALCWVVCGHVFFGLLLVVLGYVALGCVRLCLVRLDSLILCFVGLS